MLDRLTTLTDNLVLIPGAGADVAKRRPPLVAALGSCGFFPNYDCDVVEIEPGAVALEPRKKRARRRRFCPRWRPVSRASMPRCVAASAPCARGCRNWKRPTATSRRLGEKVLKLKEAKRDLKQLKAEKQALRKSPERKIGQVILAPYRLPQKLVREVRKRFGRPVASTSPAPSPNEYQKWFERASGVSTQELAAAPRRGRALLPTGR